MHTAAIAQIRATPDFNRVVTIGQDKMVRVWRTEDLKLIRAIPLPSDEGNEGDPRSLVITGKGQEVIVGGHTGISWGKQSQLYRLDLDTGRMMETIRGFNGSIESLAISRDERLLAVGTGRTGVSVIDLQGKQTVFSDGDYAERVMFADFSSDGKLATTSADGCVRIYDPLGKILFRADWPPQQDASKACLGAASLGGIRFSPDGKQLAFGVQDRPEVVLMDAQTLQFRKVIKIDETNQKSLCCIAWSPDSEQLYINGVHLGNEPTPLYRVATSGMGTVEKLAVGQNRYTNMLPLPNGDVIFSTDTPSLVRIQRGGGNRVAEALPPNLDYRYPPDKFRVSHDGRKVVTVTRPSGEQMRVFELGAFPEQAYRQATPGEISTTQPALRRGAVSMETEIGIFGYKQPTRINGNQLNLRPFQSVWSWAAHPSESVAAIGTAWSVLVADAQGKIRWQKTMPAPAYQVVVSGDGKWVVAAIGDGTIRWLAADSGTEALGSFLHTNGQDWIAWRPDGYYASSPRGDEYIGWLVNRGDRETPDLYRAVQFERQLYRPDYVHVALSQKGGQERGIGQSLQGILGDIAPPRVMIERVARREGGTMEVHFTAESRNHPIRELGVYADGIPILSTTERRVDGVSQRRVTKVVRVPEGMSVDYIRVEAETEVSVGLDETSPVQRMQGAGASQGRLRLVAIGVKEYQEMRGCGNGKHCPVEISELPNAPNDAEVLAQRMKQQAGKRFDSVDTFVLTDNTPDKPTKENILSYLKHLEGAGPNDTTILFLAAHGFSHNLAASEYYMTPRDAKLAEVDTVLSQHSAEPVPPEKTQSLLTASEIYTAFKRVPGRRILIIDTCHSGAADGRQNPYSLAKRSAAAQLAVLSAASGNELSYEALDAQHGAFTKSLLDALEGLGDADRDGFVTLREAFEFVRPRVAHNTRRMNEINRSQGLRDPEVTQTPTLVAIPAIEQTALSRHGGAPK